MNNQSAFLAILLAANAGLLATLKRALLVTQIQKKKARKPTRAFEKQFVAFLFIVLKAGSSVSNLASAWFGPLGLTLPTSVASKLLFNILFIGVILHHDTFTKNTQVATAVIIASVVFVTIVGPEVQEIEDIAELILGRPMAFIWLSIISIIYFIASCLLILTDLRAKPQYLVEAVHLCISAGSTTLGAVLSKVASSIDAGPFRILLFFLCGLTILIGFFRSYKEVAHLESLAKFVPKATSMNLFINAFTGVSTSSLTMPLS